MAEIETAIVINGKWSHTPKRPAEGAAAEFCDPVWDCTKLLIFLVGVCGLWAVKFADSSLVAKVCIGIIVFIFLLFIGIIASLLVWEAIDHAIHGSAGRYVVELNIRYFGSDTADKVKFYEHEPKRWDDDFVHDLCTPGALIAWQPRRVLADKYFVLLPPHNGKHRYHSYGFRANAEEILTLLKAPPSPYSALVAAENKKVLEAQRQAQKQEQDLAAWQNSIKAKPNYPFTDIKVGNARIAPTNQLISIVNSDKNTAVLWPEPSRLKTPQVQPQYVEIGLYDPRKSTQTFDHCYISQDDFLGVRDGSIVAFIYGYAYDVYDQVSILGVYDTLTGRDFLGHSNHPDAPSLGNHMRSNPDYKSYCTKRRAALPEMKQQAQQRKAKMMNTNNDPHLME